MINLGAPNKSSKLSKSNNRAGIVVDEACWYAQSPKADEQFRLGPFSLSCSPGEGITVVHGANGSGKSLLVQIMAGIIKPLEGSVVSDVVSSIVFQQPLIFRRSVLANITVIGKGKRFGYSDKQQLQSSALDYLKMFGLDKKSNDNALSLSGGEQRLLAIARALVLEPKILFLDEPTTFLDNKSSKMIVSLISKYAKKIRIILVTHDEELISSMPDSLIKLENGNVVCHTL